LKKSPPGVTNDWKTKSKNTEWTCEAAPPPPPICQLSDVGAKMAEMTSTTYAKSLKFTHAKGSTKSFDF